MTFDEWHTKQLAGDADNCQHERWERKAWNAAIEEAAMKTDKPESADKIVGSTDGLGSAVIVRGQVVAWFAEFTDEAQAWCTENYFGKWLTWRAMPPEIVPLTEVEYDEAMKRAAEMAALFKTPPQSP